MNVSLTDQVVIVTGAGRGIGREIALMAAEAGAHVVLVSRTREQLDEVAGLVRAQDRTALVVPTDMTDSGAVETMVKKTVDEFHRIDVLVNNAATNHIANLVVSREQDWRTVFDLNVFSVFLCTKLVLKQMIRAKSGRVINISSVSGKVGAAFNSAYASSKAALFGFTKSIALETARLGITVNAVCPWHVDTELVRSSMGSRAKMFGAEAKEYLAKIVESSPQKRVIEAREVAAMTVFLMSHDARGITGQCLNVCGGNAMF